MRAVMALSLRRQREPRRAGHGHEDDRARYACPVTCCSIADQSRSEIDAGRLVVPFDVSAPAAFSYYLVTPEAGAQAPGVAAFREWILDEAAPERGREAKATRPA